MTTMTTTMMRHTIAAVIVLVTIVFVGATTVTDNAADNKTPLINTSHTRGLQASVQVEEDDCTEIPPVITLKETIGNLSEEFSYLDGAVQIKASEGVDSVTFTVSQVWFNDGAPMISVHYPGGEDKEDICDLEATSDGEALIEYGTIEDYTAQCTYGYAEIGVYLYVGNLADFDVEECESCSAPNKDYVGYYLTLPCVSLCEGPLIVGAAASSVPTSTPIATSTREPTPAPSSLPATLTKVPTDIITVTNTETSGPTSVPVTSPVAPTEPPVPDDPVPCPEDITLIRTIGTTEFPVDKAVKIVSQDTQTVTVELNQAWTSSTSIDQIYASFKDTPFDRHCFETNNVEEGIFETITITCNFLTPKAFLEICVVDDLTHEVLSMTDQAIIPKCCEADILPETPIVCYSLEINCLTECLDETQQRKLTSPISSSSLRATSRLL